MQKIYFGGSRHQQNINSAIIGQVVRSVFASGKSVHVGCQFGADQAVISACPPSSLLVFAVASVMSLPEHLQAARAAGVRVVTCAGGSESTPLKARYLLRSIKAFQGCSQAVFFAPGAGSLAVARECVRSGLPVLAFGSMPARVPSVSGQWVSASFMGFQCWQWSAPKQISLF